MSTQDRQDVQGVNIKAEQLNFLMQTIHAHHKDFDCHQLDGLLGLAYDLAGSVYSWTEEEERIVLANEDAQRKVY
ncbi:hypothetical protein E9X60_004139 [Escherichia coli]|jgi:hypothetical protein|uniref:hypothetical protein n=1 Tax=Enterobacteriaceae TaxID=543 RepID=UPI00074197DC|nr:MULTISPECIES: hypothetical protein [Enterobacteriaceae]EMB6162611.1 hypothetical protein [Enterobacter kobei]HCQ7757803.1 hypothetical protein [Citrobacter sedlakii]EAC0075273.1 hypothetical protein [Escherichia coli]EEV9029193.1 hypothetical protein [Escherichia coli]EGD4889328.1 hypothetical protein [Escherichia coli]